MEPSTTDWIQAVAGVLTLFTALVAAFIAYKIPRLAAKFAEDYRRQHNAADEMQKLQFQFFLQLMSHRAEIAHPLARQAINAIDVVFAGFPEVRNARQMSARLALPRMNERRLSAALNRKRPFRFPPPADFK